MSFLYQRTIHFRDTDAAGVVYFANVLSMCHEAYEASLQASGIHLRTFFSDRHRAIPIVHSSVDFFQPMFCGETYSIELVPALVKPSEVSITYQIYPALSAELTTSPEVESDVGMDSVEIENQLGAEQSSVAATYRETVIPPGARSEDKVRGNSEIRAEAKSGARSEARLIKAKALSRHVCIHPLERKRLDLDEAMMAWLTTYGSASVAV